MSANRSVRILVAMKQAIAFLALFLLGCGVTPLEDSCPEPMPVQCVSPTPTAHLDVETCPGRQDVAWCRWKEDDAPDVEVSGCASPEGVQCVETCPPYIDHRPHHGTCTAPTDYAPQHLKITACADSSKALCEWFEGTTGQGVGVTACEPEAGVTCVSACGEPPVCAVGEWPDGADFEWTPCPDMPALASCRWFNPETDATICTDGLHMPAQGVQCVQSCPAVSP